MATQTTIARPAPFVESLGQDLAKQVVAQTAVPVVAPGTGGITQLAGESAGQFAARQKAAQQFDIRQQSLAGLAPQVAAQDALQKQAQTLAQQGIGSFQPFLQQAQFASAAGLSPQVAQQFMSPYQQQVIDVTLEEFDRNRAMQEQRIADQAYASGAFGGGRQGALEAEFRTGSDRERAAIQAQLLQQGYGQAQQLAAQRFGQQQGLAQLVPGLQKQDVGTLGQLGALNQAQQQAQLDAQRQNLLQQAQEPFTRLQLGQNLLQGMPSASIPSTFQQATSPGANPFLQGVGAYTTLSQIAPFGGGKSA